MFANKVFLSSFLLVALVGELVVSEAPLNKGYVPVQAPYPAAGYRPLAPFVLPQRQQVPPSAVDQLYGNPKLTTTEAETITATTENPESEDVATEQAAADAKEMQSEDKFAARQQEQEVFTEEGTYYIYHPNGLLQRVVYQTKNNVEDMGYTAQLTYKDVEPIKEPIYTYDPKTLAFMQLSK